MACYNKHFSLNGSKFDEYMAGRPTRSLRLHRVWWSARTPVYTLTFFTPTDLSRSESLESQCRSLPGGIVVGAVWLPLVIGPKPGSADAAQSDPSAPGLSPDAVSVLAGVVKDLEAIFQRAQATPLEHGCVLRLLLLYELVVDKALAVLMPINTLRNAAMLATDAPLVAMVDVDLSVNEGLTGKLMHDHERVMDLQWQAEKQHVAWVMPAWDPAHRMRFSARNDIADVVVSVRVDEKYRLRDMWLNRKLLFPFAMERGYLPGHNATDYDMWFTSKTDYPVQYQEGYEPWYIAARKVVPLYDARFRGYYMNKLVSTRHASHLLNMRVMPDVWLVHRPHEVSVSNLNWLEQKGNVSDSALDRPMVYNGATITAREAFFERNRIFYKDAVVHMRKWSYVPVADDAAVHCRSVLPWWFGACTAAEQGAGSGGAAARA